MLTLDAVEVDVDFVRPVNGEVEFGVVVEVSEDESGVDNEFVGLEARGDADDVELFLLDAILQVLHRKHNRRAASDAELHSVFDVLVNALHASDALSGLKRVLRRGHFRPRWVWKDRVRFYARTSKGSWTKRSCSTRSGNSDQ